MRKLLVDFPAAAINQNCGALLKTISPYRELQGPEIYYTMKDHQIR